MSDTHRALYPPLEPYNTGLLRVSDVHQIYYEQSGNKCGKPVLFIHGGPGSGCTPRDRQFFDPEVYRIILYDQRGAGKSLPHGELKENTTPDLVGDIEKLREHLCIDSWVVFGGSWGSLLALLYTQAYPHTVKALILRGIFLGTRKEYAWTDVHGLNMLFPDAWEVFLSPIPQENTTPDLVGDIEKLREHLCIDSWVVFGGSWGSLLALLYTQAYPHTVKALILRGIFLGTRKEYAWTDVHGLNMLFPDAWEVFLSPIPQEERGDINKAYLAQLSGDDKEIQRACLLARYHLETVTARVNIDQEALQNPELDINAAKIEFHYSMNLAFMESDDQVLNNLDKIRHIPTVIVQGRYDVICPMEAAWLLHKGFPEAEFVLVPDAGHSNKEPGILTALLDATDRFRSL